MSAIASSADASRLRLLSHLAMLVFASLIAGSFTFGAMVVPYLAPEPLNAVRFVLASAMMGLFAFGVRREKFAIPPAPWRFAIMGFLTAIYFVSMFIALTMTLPVATSAVYTLVPLMSALTAWFLVRQRSGPYVIFSLLLAGAGAVWVIFRGELSALLAFDIGQGELVYLVGCVAYAFYTPLLRRFSRGEPALTQSFFTLTATALWLALYSLPQLVSVDWASLPPIVWGVLAYLALGPTAICFFLIQYASLHLPAAKVTAYGYLVPAFVILFEGLAGHGWVSLSVLAGAAVTVSGLLLMARLPER